MNLRRLIPAVSFLFCSCLFFTGCFHSRPDGRLEQSFRQDRKKKMDDAAFQSALERGADPDQVFQNGATPLILSVVRDRPDRIELLQGDGSWKNVPFSAEGKRITVPVRLECAQIAVFRTSEKGCPE